MTHSTMKRATPSDLSEQQRTLSASDYDLRITNLARFIYRALPAKSGRFIDIGAGNGLFLKFFKDKGFDVEGVELEADQVHEMKKDRFLQDVKIRQGDITKLHGNASYDVVIASDVIEHIKDDRKALVNLYSFVKPGGYLVITVPAHSFLFGVRDKNWGHYRRYDRKDLRAKLLELPMSELVRTAYWNFFGFFAYAYYEKIRRKPINESLRHSPRSFARNIRRMLDMELRIEEKTGGFPLGLTLIAIARKRTIIT